MYISYTDPTDTTKFFILFLFCGGGASASIAQGNLRHWIVILYYVESLTYVHNMNIIIYHDRMYYYVYI